MGTMLVWIDHGTAWSLQHKGKLARLIRTGDRYLGYVEGQELFLSEDVGDLEVCKRELERAMLARFGE
jgi:hypothetical protein